MIHKNTSYHQRDDGCGTAVETALFLIRGLKFEPSKWKILGRECFPPNRALHGTNLNIVTLQCRHRTPGRKPEKKNLHNS